MLCTPWPSPTLHTCPPSPSSPTVSFFVDYRLRQRYAAPELSVAPGLVPPEPATLTAAQTQIGRILCEASAAGERLSWSKLASQATPPPRSAPQQFVHKVSRASHQNSPASTSSHPPLDDHAVAKSNKQSRSQRLSSLASLRQLHPSAAHARTLTPAPPTWTFHRGRA